MQIKEVSICLPWKKVWIKGPHYSYTQHNRARKLIPWAKELFFFEWNFPFLFLLWKRHIMSLSAYVMLHTRTIHISSFEAHKDTHLSEHSDYVIKKNGVSDATEDGSIFERKPACFLCWKKINVGRNKVSVTVLGPKLSLACVTFGGLLCLLWVSVLLPNR